MKEFAELEKEEEGVAEAPEGQETTVEQPTTTTTTTTTPPAGEDVVPELPEVSSKGNYLCSRKRWR